MTKVWFITGAARGLGLSLTEAALKRGDSVVATARNIGQLQELVDVYGKQVLALELVVTDFAKIPQAVSEAVKHFGRLDVLVNNAGFGIVGAAEAYSEDQVSSQLETNLYAPIAITRAVLPYMRKQGFGRILQISSIGGRVGNAGLTIYQAAKFGLSGFSEALAKEVAPLGIYVTSVEPGGFRTDWSGASVTYADEIDGYELVKQRTDLFKSDAFIPVGDPKKAAKVMIDLVSHANPPMHLVLGSEAIGILKNADFARKAELEEWLKVSFSTDHDQSEDFLETPQSKFYLSGPQRKA